MSVAAPSLDSQLILVNAPGRPFHGLAHDKAIFVNEALTGYLVRVESDRDALYGEDQRKRQQEEIYVFGGMALPGEWSHGLGNFVSAYDLYLEHLTSGWGSKRILSPNLVVWFQIASRDRYYRCVECGRMKPRQELFVDEFSEAKDLFCRRRCGA